MVRTATTSVDRFFQSGPFELAGQRFGNTNATSMSALLAPAIRTIVWEGW